MSRVKDATSKMVRCIPGYEGKLTPRQRDVYQTLLDVGEASEKELCYFTGASASVVRALVEKGAAEAFGIRGVPPPQIFFLTKRKIPIIWCFLLRSGKCWRS